MVTANNIKRWVRKLPFADGFLKNFDTQANRDAFISERLKDIPAGSVILDAGCGSQRYKPFCSHLIYKAQDFGGYITEEKTTLISPMLSANIDAYSPEGYAYGALDYVGNIWEIKESDRRFDAILCTEVFEHIPYPNETVSEFSRLLKTGGTLILTAPSSCLRHMDPYFFYSGFSDRWHHKILTENGFEIESMEQVGDYYSWMAYELAKSAFTHSIFAKIALLPAFLFFNFKNETDVSRNSLCFAYQITAKKL